MVSKNSTTMKPTSIFLLLLIFLFSSAMMPPEMVTVHSVHSNLVKKCLIQQEASLHLQA